MNEGAMEVPKEAKAIEHPAFDAVQGSLLKRLVIDLQGRGVTNAEGLVRDFVLDDYGSAGLQVYAHSPEPATLDSDGIPIFEADAAGDADEEGKLADPGGMAMSLRMPDSDDADDLAANIDELCSLKVIDADHAAGLKLILKGRDGAKAVRVNLQTIIGAANRRQSQAMSLNRSRVRPRATPANAPRHPWGAAMTFPGHVQTDTAADVRGRQLVGLDKQ